MSDESLLDFDQILEDLDKQYQEALQLISYLDNIWYWREYTEDEYRQYDKACEIIEKHRKVNNS